VDFRHNVWTLRPEPERLDLTHALLISIDSTILMRRSDVASNFTEKSMKSLGRQVRVP
jgi:hypothetical protein